MCCIGALIIIILNSLHHEVVGNLSIVSSNPQILYNTHYITTTLYYTYLSSPYFEYTGQNMASSVSFIKCTLCSSSGSGGGSGGGDVSVVLYYYRYDIDVL